MVKNLLSQYRKLEAKHVKKLQEWVDADPANLQNLHNHIGNGRSIADYVDEYNFMYAIAARLAQDINYPDADKMFSEYDPYSELDGTVFGD